MKPKKLSALLASYFALGVGAPLPGLMSQLQINGAQVDPNSLVMVGNQILSAGAAADQFGFATSAAASITLTALQNLTQRLTNGGAVVVTLDSAWNIVNGINNPFVGQTFNFWIAATGATTVATPTLTGTGVTLSGTTSVLAGALRQYNLLLTQIVTTAAPGITSGATFTSIAQVGSTNRYTVTLSGNSVSPSVGQGFFLGVSAGTLPAGWYPVDQVTSANSFVVVLPPSSTAWTATAATLSAATTIPSSGFTPGLAGLFSPLLTIAGVWATITANITV